jgi:hypothetical protein
MKYKAILFKNHLKLRLFQIAAEARVKEIRAWTKPGELQV